MHLLDPSISVLVPQKVAQGEEGVVCLVQNQGSLPYIIGPKNKMYYSDFLYVSSA